MKKQYQVTLKSTTGKYKPISCIITKEQKEDVNLLLIKEEKTQIINAGVIKICGQRYWGKRDIIEQGFTIATTRVYDKEKIAKENKERYEQIKEAKYQSGEWQRPKGKEKE